jgi:glycosyltransferase involved in cell wall biosynthesis
MMGRLTAVVVNKNEAKGLELTIKSLRNQETPVEIVVVDGGSTDGSWEIATSMADKAVRGYGLGMGLDRVIGIKQASGDFIISCDSDAIYPPHYSTLAKELLGKYCAWTGPIYPKDSKDWKRLAELESLGSHFVSIAPWCYSEDTLILTERGWIPFPELTEEDRVATRDNGFSYVKPLKIIKYFYEGFMVYLKNRAYSALVTPDHPILARSLRGNRSLVRVPALLFKKASRRKPYRWIWETEWKGRETIPKNLVRLVAWFLAEGYLHSKGRIVICQKTSKGVARLREVLESAGFREVPREPERSYHRLKPFTYTVHPRGFYIAIPAEYSNLFPHFKDATKKSVPPRIKEQPRESLKLFLEAYAHGDGSFYKTHFKIYTTSPFMLRDLTEIGLKAGYRISFYRRENCGKFHSSDWVITFFENFKQSKFPSPSQIKLVPYRGYVYDVVLPGPSHEILVSHKGRVYWASNCYEHNLIFKKSVFLNLGLDKLPYLSRFDIGVPVKIFLRPEYEPNLYCYSRLPTYLFKRLFWWGEIL